MILSLESSSIGTVTNLDWPTRTMEVMINIASARRAFVAAASSDFSANLSTSLVRALAKAVPVKKSPPKRSAAIQRMNEKDWMIAVNEHLLLSGGLAAALTASNFAVLAFENAVSVAYVPSARILGLPPPSLLTFSFSSFPSSPFSSEASSSSFCSEARMGISPMVFLTSLNAFWISSIPPTYSPSIHRTPRKTFPDLISVRV